MKKGLLILAYGSPNNLDDVEPYYTDIRRGVPPPHDLLEELKERYAMIGGSSPLLKVTHQQADIIQKACGGVPTYVGMRHWTPWIPEALADMQRDGITHAACMVMAPHYSTMSIAKYMGLVEKGCQELNYDLEWKFIESWHDHNLYIQALADRIRAVTATIPPEELPGLKYIFSAHSLPEKILAGGDPYPNELMTSSRLLAAELGLEEHQWRFAFQSAGRTQEKWLGPDILEVIEEEAANGTKAILASAIGFLVDHLEVVYDIDIEGQQKAEETGIHLYRAISLHDHPNIGTLAADKLMPILNEWN